MKFLILRLVLTALALIATLLAICLPAHTDIIPTEHRLLVDDGKAVVVVSSSGAISILGEPSDDVLALILLLQEAKEQDCNKKVRL